MQDPPEPASKTPGGRHDEPLSEVRRFVDGVEGWLSDDQVAALHFAAASVPASGTIVEIGSFRGRSTIVLAAASKDGVEVVAIDPHAGNDRGPQEIAGYAEEAATDNEVFRSNLANAGVLDRVRHVRAFSDAAHDDVDGNIDMLFIDGAHRYAPARDDIVDWGERIRDGGSMYIHDTFSSVGVTLAVLVKVAFNRRWHYLGRNGSLTGYRASMGPGDRAGVSSSLRQIGSLPWFARNLVIKVLIVAKLGRLTRVFGHRQPTWPY